MKSLIYKDLSIIKKSINLKKILFFFILFIAFCYFIGKEASVFYITIVFMMEIMRIYNEEISCGFYSMCRYMPVNPKKIVLSKYIVNLIVVIISFLLTLAVTAVMYVLYRVTGISILEGFVVNSESVGNLALVNAVLYIVYLLYYPLELKFKNYSAIFLFAIVFLGAKLFRYFYETFKHSINFISGVSISVTAYLVALLIIFVLSVRLVNKTE